MKTNDMYIMRGKIILTIAAIFLIMSICLVAANNIDFNSEEYTISYESINIKGMAAAKVAIKQGKSFANEEKVIKSTQIEEVVSAKLNNNQEEKTTTVKQVANVNKQIWYLPTEQGTITQYPHYGHVALDITSPRGIYENIYPVADGVVSSIYYDYAGAKIVTIRHLVNDKYYTSQYVHLSSYADGLYVGKEVSVHDSIGRMGATGIATGVHLHLTVVDCNLYDPNDYNCSDINGFFNYNRARLSQGFYGLGSLMYVPYSWYSR